jgi:hypothetical protein
MPVWRFHQAGAGRIISIPIDFDFTTKARENDRLVSVQKPGVRPRKKAASILEEKA